MEKNLTVEQLRKKYPMESLEGHFEKIEKEGYQVSPCEYQCTIWKGTKLIIDADEYDDFHSNAASAIHCFYID